MGGLPQWTRDRFSTVALAQSAGRVQKRISPEPVLDSRRALCERAESQGGRYAVVYVAAKLRVLGPACSWPETSTLTDCTAHLSPLREAIEEFAVSERISLLDLTTPLADFAADGPGAMVLGRHPCQHDREPRDGRRAPRVACPARRALEGCAPGISPRSLRSEARHSDDRVTISGSAPRLRRPRAPKARSRRIRANLDSFEADRRRRA